MLLLSSYETDYNRTDINGSSSSDDDDDDDDDHLTFSLPNSLYSLLRLIDITHLNQVNQLALSPLFFLSN